MLFRSEMCLLFSPLTSEALRVSSKISSFGVASCDDSGLLSDPSAEKHGKLFNIAILKYLTFKYVVISTYI